MCDCTNENLSSSLPLLSGDPLLGGTEDQFLSIYNKHAVIFVQVAVDIFTVVLVGKLIEPLWGALEMMTFFFIINTGNVLSMLFEVNLLMVNIHRCCCPLCDFLLPPLHDHRECRPLISGSKFTKCRPLASHEFIVKYPGAHSWSLWLPGWGEHCSEASYARPCACQVK